MESKNIENLENEKLVLVHSEIEVCEECQESFKKEEDKEHSCLRQLRRQLLLNQKRELSLLEDRIQKQELQYRYRYTFNHP